MVTLYSITSAVLFIVGCALPNNLLIGAGLIFLALELAEHVRSKR